MTGAEVLCAFMEIRPITYFGPRQLSEYYRGNGPAIHSPHSWWELGRRPHCEPGQWYPRSLDLDALHEIEERLTDEQWASYETEITKSYHDTLPHFTRWAIHATAKQKIKALAQVLRPVVEEKG